VQPPRRLRGGRKGKPACQAELRAGLQHAAWLRAGPAQAHSHLGPLARRAFPLRKRHNGQTCEIISSNNCDSNRCTARTRAMGMPFRAAWEPRQNPS
jgi:hypothetical protein